MSLERLNLQEWIETFLFVQIICKTMVGGDGAFTIHNLYNWGGRWGVGGIWLNLKFDGIRKKTKRLNRSVPMFLLDLTWPQGRFMAGRNWKSLLSQMSIALMIYVEKMADLKDKIVNRKSGAKCPKSLFYWWSTKLF